jgi:uncharacterized membrane protein YvbJ
MNCPKCGTEIETQQARAAKARWAKTTGAKRKKLLAKARAGRKSTPTPAKKTGMGE